MKVLILYFSGTGNTYYVGNIIKEKLQKVVDIEIQSIEQISLNGIPQHDILFLGFPVYETDSPIYLQEFINDIPQVLNKGLFLFVTHGGVPGNVLWKNFKRMIAKGYIPLGYLSIGMMDTGAITFMKKDSLMVKYIKNRDYTKLKKIDMFVDRTKGILSKIKDSDDIIKNRIHIPFNKTGFTLDWLWKMLYKIWGNRLKKKFWVDEKCIMCGLCIQICPVKNISKENNKIVFEKKCFLCFRCINQCPSEAIQIGKKTVDKFRWKGPDNCFRPILLKR